MERLHFQKMSKTLISLVFAAGLAVGACSFWVASLLRESAEKEETALLRSATIKVIENNRDITPDFTRRFGIPDSLEIHFEVAASDGSETPFETLSLLWNPHSGYQIWKTTLRDGRITASETLIRSPTAN